MGKRNARISRIVKEERLYFGINEEHPAVIRKSQYQREKQKDRKSKMKLAKLDFAKTCIEISRANDPENLNTKLPSCINSNSISDDMLQYVYSFLNTLLNFFEKRNCLHKLNDIYSESASVTLQVAPYILLKNISGMQSTSHNTNRGEESSFESLMLYMSVSSNILKGCCPLPSWAWALECDELGYHLSKRQRIELKNIRLLQRDGENNFKKISRRRQFTSLSMIKNINKSIQFFAHSLWEIRHLFSRMPKLIAIRDEDTISLDIVDSGPFGIYFRAKILALEPVNLQSNETGLRIPFPPNVRWIQRTIILLPPPADKICHEDICIMPVSETAQQKYSEIIRCAIDNWRVSGGADSTNQSSSTSGVQTLPPLMPSYSDADLDVKIADLSLSSGMNKDFSRQCLLECGWDSELAFEAFQRARTAGMLPDLVFLE